MICFRVPSQVNIASIDRSNPGLIITYFGKNVRKEMVNCLHRLHESLLQSRADDTISFSYIIAVSYNKVDVQLMNSCIPQGEAFNI